MKMTVTLPVLGADVTTTMMIPLWLIPWINTKYQGMFYKILLYIYIYIYIYIYVCVCVCVCVHC
jgi:hypothetical protein